MPALVFDPTVSQINRSHGRLGEEGQDDIIIIPKGQHPPPPQFILVEVEAAINLRDIVWNMS